MDDVRGLNLTTSPIISGELLRQRVENIRNWAALIQRWIDSPPPLGEVHIYRMLWVDVLSSSHRMRALSVFVPHDQAPFAQVQAPYQDDGQSLHKLTTGQYITATELAVFLGLETLVYGYGDWIRQVIPIATHVESDLTPAADGVMVPGE